ncbi:UV DNA damage repair endonuclease UvsE [uncultured Methanofollis sp.]|uniref:UV DNA damage repair endonuclease UvsE n=1 Tax=uncultured Methanofollis sp. TaxID=262500 RepID=UPI002606094E|nr:UV DNA damage repair endonuclease UvsE [uncultured Methanofollis sp.]
MKIGYPCTNLTIGTMKGSLPDNLRTLEEEEEEAVVVENLACLARTLEFNEKAGLSFFSIDPRVVPHRPGAYAEYLAAIGSYVREKGMRVMICPVRAALSPARRGDDLTHLASILDTMDLDTTAKIAVGIGSGDRGSAEKFYQEYDHLPDAVTRRLVIRNDRVHSVEDCCAIGRACGVPVAYDHHQARGDPGEAVRECARTWGKEDGVPIVFYGSLEPGVPHPPSVNPAAFEAFLAAIAPPTVDVMLLFRDRERSALMARRIADRQRVMSAPAQQTL